MTARAAGTAAADTVTAARKGHKHRSISSKARFLPGMATGDVYAVTNLTGTPTSAIVASSQQRHS